MSHAYCTFLSTLDYKFSLTSHAILSATTVSVDGGHFVHMM